MGKRRIKPQTSVKQILVRNFNWRMGNLRRLRLSMWGLDDDVKAVILDQLDLQETREQYRHEGRLMALLTGDPGRVFETDVVLQTAFREVDINKRWIAELEAAEAEAQQKPT